MAARHKGLTELAKKEFYLEGEVYQLITFLNLNLKTRGLIFGLSIGEKGRYLVSIYDEPSLDCCQQNRNKRK